MQQLSALDLRKGFLVEYQGRICTVTDWTILRNDRRQNVRLQLKDVRTGRVYEVPKEATDAKYSVLEYQNVDLTHSYREGGEEVFYDADGAEFRCAAEAAKDALLWQCESYKGFLVDGNLIQVSTPISVVATITDTAPPMKGSSSGTKDAMLENGIKVRVSQLCQTGDKIRLDPETLEFRERV
jgi:translation elongation factor P/translation initiation factor 5A